MATTLIDLNNNKLVFNSKEVLFIEDKEKNLWFKGTDVAKLLGYSDANRALNQHITKDKYKLIFKNIKKGVLRLPSVFL